MRNKTRTYGIIAGICALAIPAALFLNRSDVAPPAPAPQPNAKYEAKAKKRLLQNDVAITNELCRTQCRNDLTRAAQQVNRLDGAGMQRSLSALQQEHPHMKRLEWVSAAPTAAAASGQKPAAVGSIPSGVKAKALEQIEKAKEAVRRGQAYESKPLKDRDGEVYFVLGTPSKERKNSGIVGVVHQHVLKKVEQHQIRNLRLKEYPNDRRYGIRAIDPNTGKEVDVETPEENQGISHYIHKEVVVRFHKPPTDKQLQQIKKDLGVTRHRKLGYSHVFEGNKSTKEMLAYFQKLGVDYAEPHYLYVTNQQNRAEPIVPNDALYSRYQWNIPIIGTPTGWELSRGNEQVTVAVVDTGVDLTHPDLKGRIVDGYNVVDPKTQPNDDVGHGTHVAGVISALTDNAEGVAGMTWYNRIMPVKVLDSSGMGSTYAVAEGIIWATDHGAKVINMSLGNYASAQFLHDAVKYAFDRDVALISATGNDNTDQPGYPAAYPEVFAVSATNVGKQKASFSNFGDYVDVVAPGENIASTYMGNQYAALSGTSMASPHVAALAALIRSVNPKLKNTEVYDIMRKSAVDLGAQGKDTYYGYGQIDVARALQLASGKAPAEAAADKQPERTIPRNESLLQWFLRLLTGSAR
ncbi:S8 family peptidase [Paenibacillus thermotolerans]|uniref:S8 family peptidase n=1 Tax=Paenibacillus thermotolerans TaxID=3027807 RepID=UPI0023679595|nr:MULTISPECIES: S8 family peptidase [unclassified Paenibacillus]